jgi:hypothetical protein
MSYLFSSSPSSCDYRTRSTIMSSVDPERDYQPSSPLNSNEPVTFHHSPNSQTEYSSDDGAYRVPSPSTSEGNQQGYYNKYGKWPAVPNGTDVLLQKVLGTLDPEQGTVGHPLLTPIHSGSPWNITRKSLTVNVGPKIRTAGPVNDNAAPAAQTMNPTRKIFQPVKPNSVKGSMRLLDCYGVQSACLSRQ